MKYNSNLITMKRKILFFTAIFFTLLSYSQVNSVNKLRIRNASSGNVNTDEVLTIKPSGLVRKVPVLDLMSNTTFDIGENDVALTNTYNNLKKLIPSVVDEGYVYIDNSGGYVFSFNGDNALAPTSKLYDLQVGDSVFIQGVDGELGTLTITDYVFSDPANLYLEFGSNNATDFVDSNGITVAENNPNFTDPNGVVQFRVLINDFTETTPTVVGDVLNYLDENFIQYTASQGIQIKSEDIQLGGALTDNVQIDLNNEDFRLRDATDNVFRSDFNKNLINLNSNQIDIESRGTTGTFFNPDLSVVSQGNIRMDSRSNTQPFVISSRSDGDAIGFLINSETGDGDGSFTTYLTTGNDNKAFRYNGAVGQTVFSNPSDIVDKNYVDGLFSSASNLTEQIQQAIINEKLEQCVITTLSENRSNYEIDSNTATIVNSIASLETAILNATNGDQILIQEGVNLDFTGGVTRIDIDKEILVGAENPENPNTILFGTTASSFNLISDNIDIVALNFVGGYFNENINNPSRVGLVVNNVNGAAIYGCSFSGFTAAGINLKNAKNVRIYDSKFYRNRKIGLGYGILLEGDSKTEVFNNFFEENRHHITGSGEQGQGYEAYNNYFGKSGVAAPNKVHVIDMHETNGNAGEYVIIRNNFIEGNDVVPLVIRGYPEKFARIYENTFGNSNRASSIRQTRIGLNTPGVNGIVPNNQLVNMQVYDNKYQGLQNNIINQTDDIFIFNDKGVGRYDLYNNTCEIVAHVFGYNHRTKGNYFGLNESYLFFFDNYIQIATYDIDDSLIFRNIDITIKPKQVISGNFSNMSNEDVIIIDNNNDIYLITIASDLTVTETLLLSNIDNQTILKGNFITTGVEDIVVVEPDGDFILRQNNSGAFDITSTLMTLTGHNNFVTGDFSTNGFDDIWSTNGNLGGITIINTGTVIGSNFRQRTTSADNFDHYFVQDNEIGKDELFGHHENSGGIIWFESANALSGLSFTEISYVGVIDDMLKINLPEQTGTVNNNTTNSILTVTGTNTKTITLTDSDNNAVQGTFTDISNPAQDISADISELTISGGSTIRLGYGYLEFTDYNSGTFNTNAQVAGGSLYSTLNTNNENKYSIIEKIIFDVDVQQIFPSDVDINVQKAFSPGNGQDLGTITLDLQTIQRKIYTLDVGNQVIDLANSQKRVFAFPTTNVSGGLVIIKSRIIYTVLDQ